MRLLATFFLLFALLTVDGANTFFDDPFMVSELAAEGFEASVQLPGDLVVAQFFTPNKKCKAAQKEYEKLGAKLYGLFKVVALDISSSSGKTVGAKFAAAKDNVPLVKVFQGDKVHDYSGDLTASALEAFVKSLVVPQVAEATHKKHKAQVKNTGMPKAILFEDDRDEASRELFKTFSMRFKGRMDFLSVSSKEKKLLKQYEVSAKDVPKLLVLPAYNPDDVLDDDETPRRPYSLGFKAYQLGPFLERYALQAAGAPAFPEPQMVDNSCMQELCIKRGGLCVIAILPSQDKALLRYNVQLLREMHRNRDDALYSFSWLDGEAQAEFVQQAFGMMPSESPQLVVLSPSKLRFTEMVGAYQQHDVAVFLRQLGSGKIPTQPLESGALPALSEPEGAAPACKPTKEKPKPKPSGGDKKPAAEGAREKVSYPSRPRSRSPQVLDTTNQFAVVTESMAHFVVIFQHGNAVPEAFTEASTALKNMVQFAFWNVDKTKVPPAELSDVLAGTLPVIVAFQAGTDKKVDFKVLGAEASPKDAAAAMVRSGNELVYSVTSLDSFREWATNPLQPRLLYCSPKPEKPLLLAALASEFEHTVDFGISSPGDTPVCKQFNGEATADTQMVLIITGELGKAIANTNPPQHEVMVKAQQVTKQNSNFADIAGALDQFTDRYVSAREKAEDWKGQEKKTDSKQEL